MSIANTIYSTIFKRNSVLYVFDNNMTDLLLSSFCGSPILSSFFQPLTASEQYSSELSLSVRIFIVMGEVEVLLFWDLKDLRETVLFNFHTLWLGEHIFLPFPISSSFPSFTGMAYDTVTQRAWNAHNKGKLWADIRDKVSAESND